MLSSKIPLSERVRPKELSDLAGQKHLVGTNGVLRKALERSIVPSMILWGPPGTGKTTLANIIAHQSKRPFKVLSAISSGVKEIREVISFARTTPRTILFIDEIHRFNKGQQDALLGAVEMGIITLIGATTENPSFEVNNALLSRSQVYTLTALSEDDLLEMLHSALKRDPELSKKEINFKSYEALLRLSDGDARKLLNLTELVVAAFSENKITLDDDMVLEIAQQKIALYDKEGEQHYDIVSAFIKSIRGTDPNAAVYWLARMIEGGEDAKFIARRMLIAAAEDIGNANPTALVIATNCFQAVTFIGYPEARIILSQTATYLASSPKSNAAYMAINHAQRSVTETGNLPVPLHLRNAPTKLMKNQGYGKDYQYAHNHESNFVEQEFLPDVLGGTTFYDPGKNAREEEIRKRLKFFWKDKYGY